ncbi:hypothetical protein FRC07_010947 [Ceratobasidium sp. 392]|nr:hypothetical protein FRC07_010947 [Ceratobasidium sp. 392]
MKTYQPATDFHNRLEVTLMTQGIFHSATNLLTGLLITTMALITTAPQFVLKPIAINHILSLREEISVLCEMYKVNVVFQFDSAMETPAYILEDFLTLNISGAMLTRDPILWKRSNRNMADTQLLLNFLELVRVLMNYYGPLRVADIIADFDQPTSLHLPPTAIRKPGVGGRVANPYRSGSRQSSRPRSSPTRLVQALRWQIKPASIRFNPFGSRSRAHRVQPSNQERLQLDLNDEPNLVLLLDAPLRMRRRRFGFAGI